MKITLGGNYRFDWSEKDSYFSLCRQGDHGLQAGFQATPSPTKINCNFFPIKCLPFNRRVNTMNTKSRATDALADLASDSTSLNREMLELGYLRQLVADKEKAVKPKIEDIRLANLPSGQSSLPKTLSSAELPEKAREFLTGFLADRGALL